MSDWIITPENVEEIAFYIGAAVNAALILLVVLMFAFLAIILWPHILDMLKEAYPKLTKCEPPREPPLVEHCHRGVLCWHCKYGVEVIFPAPNEPATVVCFYGDPRSYERVQCPSHCDYFEDRKNIQSYYARRSGAIVIEPRQEIQVAKG